MKKGLCLIIGIVLLLSTPSQSFAQTSTTFYITSEYIQPVIGEIFAMPFSLSSKPLIEMTAPYDNLLAKFVISFTNLPQGSYYIFIFQSMNQSKTYNPYIDPSYYDDNQGNGFPNNYSAPLAKTLTPVELTGNTYSVTKQGDMLEISIANTANTINFLNDTHNLIMEISSPDSIYTQQARISPTCPIYYCGIVSSAFSHVSAGTYTISVLYGDETLLAIPDATALLTPPTTLSPTLSERRQEHSQELSVNMVEPTKTMTPTPTPSIFLKAISKKVSDLPMPTTIFQQILVIFSHIVIYISHVIQIYL